MEHGWFSTRVTLDELVKGRGPYRVADVFDAGSGLALGATLEGFELAAKREDASAPGVGLMRANQSLLGTRWSTQAMDPRYWRGVTADVVVSTAGDEEAAATVMGYAARLKPAVLVFDAIPGTFAADTMAADLSRLTRLRYHGTAVLYNDLSFGVPLDRCRELLVLSQLPFGVDPVHLDWLPSADDAVMDLLDLEPMWGNQPLVRSPTWYTRALRTPQHAVDGFMTAPDYRTMRTWEWKRPGIAPSPEGLLQVRGRDLHLLTHREVARLLGFPDSWLLGTAPRGMNGRYLGVHWECATAIPTARWVMRWVAQSMNGSPGPLRAPVIDLSHHWEPLAQRQWGVSTS